MARGVNKAILIGNLGKDPEVRYTQGGSAVTNFSVATTERRKQGDEWSDHTEWHNVVVFGKAAENCGKYLQKGSQVYLEGRIQTRKWEDRDGNTRYSTEVVAFDVHFLSRAKGQDGRASAGPEPAAPAGGPATGFDPNDDVHF